VILAHFTVETTKPCSKKFTKTLFLGFKVVEGHRCWYPRKARQQCNACYDKQQLRAYLQPFSC